MSELELLMGSQAAWRKLRKALILLAGLLNTEHSEIGMLDEILSDGPCALSSPELSAHSIRRWNECWPSVPRDIQQ